MIENEEYDLNVTNDGELSASLFPPGGDYYYGTSSTTLPTAKDEENVKHLALACSKLSEENTCKRGIIISASINVSSTASQHDIVNARDDWERWFQQALSTAPDTVRGSAFQTSSAWSYADTVEELAKGAKTALVASFFFAFIVAFFASRSFAIAFATCFSVAFACAASLGLSATFRDWKFGVIESVCVTLLVGLSVDYPLHVASAYAAASSSLKNANDDANVVGERERKEREQDKESLFENTPTSTTMTATKTKTKTTNDLLRASRALQAIRSVGPSVIGGAFTTASAAGFLFAGCVIVFFSTFGAFVIVTLCLSVFSSAFVSVAALAVVGPL
jgi:predicted RND superfamily exporter protein